jgi:hypothetical protein
MNRARRHLHIQKTSQKKNYLSSGGDSRAHIFVDRKQATAVTMGKVLASAQKISSMSNPAIALSAPEGGLG